MQDRPKHHTYLIIHVSWNFHKCDIWWRKKREHEIVSIYFILQTSTRGNCSQTIFTGKIFILWRGSCGVALCTSSLTLQVSIEFLKSGQNGCFLEVDAKENYHKELKCRSFGILITKAGICFFPESSILPLLMKIFKGSKEIGKCIPVVRLQCQENVKDFRIVL